MNTTQLYIANDWKHPGQDFKPFLPPAFRPVVIGLYVSCLLCLLGAGALALKAYQLDARSQRITEESQQSSLLLQKTTHNLEVIREGSQKFDFICKWMANEFAMAPLLVELIRTDMPIKLNSFSIKMLEQRQLFRLELEVVGSAKQLQDYLHELKGKLAARHLEVTHLDQPRIPGGSKLVLRIRIPEDAINSST